MRPKSILVGAILTIGCLAVQLEAAEEKAATKAAEIKAKKQPASGPASRFGSKKRANETEALNKQPPATGERAPTAKSSVGKSQQKAAKKIKFQSRIMRSAHPLGPAEQQGESQFAGESLVPTFIDQEQGDDMVALASDSSGELVAAPTQQVKVLPQVNRSVSSNSYMKRYQADRQQRESDADEKYLREQEQGKERSSQPADDYYADEEDDDEEQVAAGKAQASAPKHQPLQAGVEHPQRVPDIESGLQQTQKAPDNKTDLTFPARGNSGAWTPTSARQQPTQVDATTAARRPAPAERFAGLFSGRESIGTSLTKTDMAIEYLRNILKTKQGRQQTNSSRPNDAPAQEAIHQKGLKTFYPLPVQLRDFVQMANKSDPSPSPPNATQKTPTPDQSAGGKKIEQLTSSKFSIGDVKLPAREEAAPATLSSRTPSPSSLAPSSDAPSKHSTEEIKSTTKPIPPPSNVPAESAPAEFPLMSPANGTPLGGDYIEGQDDSPRPSPDNPFGAQPLPSQNRFENARPRQQSRLSQQEATEQMSAAASEHSAARPVAAYSSEHYTLRQLASQPSPLPPQAISSVYFQMQAPPARHRPEYQHGQPDEPRLPQSLAVESHYRAAQQTFERDQSALDDPKYSQQNEQVGGNEQPGEFAAKPKQTKTSEAQTSLDQPDDFGLEELKQSKLDEPLNEPVAVQRDTQQAPPHQQMISSKLYKHEQPAAQYPTHFREQPRRPSTHANQLAQKRPQDEPGHQQASFQRPPPPYAEQQPHEHRQQRFGPRPPKIVSYNYYESPSESGHEGAQATNFQFGDSLLSSSGDVEHTLSSTELEAIQSQFMTAEHPTVPLGEYRNQHEQPELSLPRLLANLKTGSSELLHKLVGQNSNGDPLKGQASSIDERAAAESGADESRAKSKAGADGKDNKAGRVAQAERTRQELPLAVKPSEKRKSLVVYLNHPRDGDMSRAASAGEEGLAQLISDQTSGDPFVSAREFDARGLSRDTKHLDVANIRGLGQKEPADKDGLSVVVIGDAYKYKKIVLLISAKSGGLKFIPMVKDMKR